ncbi:hypothetical protein [Glaciihabitans sp. dw_435]|uniref:hypothetical protein n=1 Tax=Glaciihabitans sp. dw_435 TaxID=2720081 RepID=UPI001BD23382|nr:hypothetical protein [Glaciihabitans sp. dw_435]
MTSPVLRSALRFYRSDFLMYAAVAVVTAVSSWVALEAWKANWKVPFAYIGGDGGLIAAHFKTVLETGWYEVQPLLGAPSSQIYYDWKVADNLHFMWAWLLGHLLGNPFLAENVYYFIGYIFAGLTAAWFMRTVGMSRLMTIVMATLYAIAPFHFIRNENHMWFASYYSVPLALVVVYWIISGQPLWSRRPNVNVVWGVLTGRGVATLLCLAISGTASTYYSFYTLMFFAAAGLIALVRYRRWTRFIGAALAGLFLLAVMVLNMLPDILYAHENGANTQAVARTPGSSYVFSLRLSDLLLPVPFHRIPELAELRAAYETVFGPSERPVLGVVAGLGLLLAIGFAIYRISAVARPRGIRPALGPTQQAVGHLTALTLLGLLISTAGGFSVLIALFTSDVRGWNRMSILLALFCISIVGLLVDATLRRFAVAGIRRKLAPVLAFVVAVVIFSIGYYDQTPPGIAVQDYAGTAASFKEDAAFIAKIDKTIPTGASVLQLPYRRFPETTRVNDVSDSDQLMPYLHSATTHWSGGGIKGRPLVEWQGTLGTLPTTRLVAATAASGFSGILVDRKPYADDGDLIVAQLTRSLGKPLVVSDDGRRVFFSTERATTGIAKLYSAAEQTEIKNRTTQAVYAYSEPNFDRDGYNFLSTINAGYKVGIELDNPTDKSVTLDLTFRIADGEGPTNFTLNFPDGSALAGTAVAHGTTMTTPVTVGPGKTYLPITLASGKPIERIDGIRGTLKVTSVTALDTRLSELLARVTVPVAEQTTTK